MQLFRRVDVHEDAIPAEVFDQSVGQTTGVTCCIVAAVADEDSRELLG